MQLYANLRGPSALELYYFTSTRQAVEAEQFWVVRSWLCCSVLIAYGAYTD
jgi:hypothetical protein